jgi:hypothetical protein
LRAADTPERRRIRHGGTALLAHRLVNRGFLRVRNAGLETDDHAIRDSLTPIRRLHAGKRCRLRRW